MMNTFHTLGDEDDARPSDSDSQKNIIKETNYTVTSNKIGGEKALHNPDMNMVWDRENSRQV
jgi:hypothetical protein